MTNNTILVAASALLAFGGALEGFASEDPCKPGWVATFEGAPGVSGSVRAMVVHDDGTGPALFAGGAFTEAAGVDAHHIARWNGSDWLPVGDGMNNAVRALAGTENGPDGGSALYVGGAFTMAGGTAVHRIARWDGANWYPLGSGLDGPVYAMTIFDNGFGPALYAGGDFTTAGGIAANNIARWDGTTWSAVGEGVNDVVRALTPFDDGSGSGPALFAGGDFTEAGEIMTSRIARWDGAAWSAVGRGINGTVRALSLFDDGSGNGPALYVGGAFSEAGEISARSIARWDGVTWSALGSGFIGAVAALTTAQSAPGQGSRLFAGGGFHVAGEHPSHNVAQWDGKEWSPVEYGLGPFVWSLSAFDDGSGSGDELYAGGSFTFGSDGLFGPRQMRRISKWNGSEWMPVGRGFGNYFNSGAQVPTTIRSSFLFDDGLGRGTQLYVGGDFVTVDGKTVNAVATWDGNEWSALKNGLFGEVIAMTAFDDGSGDGPALYVGGRILPIGDPAISNIARWDGETWLPLGSGIPPSAGSSVNALTVFDDGSGSGPALYAGGRFTTAGETIALNIARWDGAQWSSVGGGVNGEVRALTVFDDGKGPALYVGGDFTLAGDVATHRIAKWDGITWSSLGAGVSATTPVEIAFVAALTGFDDGGGPALYVGGKFKIAGNEPAANIARWDGSAWSPLGTGVIGPVLTVREFDDGSGNGDELYIGGTFVMAGDNTVNRIAKWRHEEWQPLDQGVAAAPSYPHWAFIFTLSVVESAEGQPAALIAGGAFVNPTTGESALSIWQGCAVKAPCVPADLNCDGTIDLGDLLVLLQAWGPCPDMNACPADLNGDGSVDLSDLLLLLRAWNSMERPS